jgi:mono/diheme cytochrome c family protein
MRKAGVRAFVALVAVAAAAVWGAHTNADQSASRAPVARVQAPPVPVPAAAAAKADASPDAYRAMLKQYCIGCHNQRVKTAEIAFDNVDLAHVGEHAELWEKAIRKLKAGMMPPPGARRPEKAMSDAFAAWLETSLDAHAAANPDPGRVAVHRLNRTEYAAAIDDLLALKIDPAAMLPKDDEADGFDNIATSLAVSPSFLDQYISAARVVTNRALGVPGTKATSVTYRPARGTDQAVRADGLPLGTRGGLVVEHNFPADGDYKLNINGLPIAGYLRGMEYQHTVVVLLDGVKIFENTIGGPEDLKSIDQQQAAAVTAVNNRFQNIALKTTAGPHTLGVTFVARTLAESDDVLFNFRPGSGEERIPKIGSVDVLGPFTAEGLGNSPSRQRVLICKPTGPADESACAKQILTQLARRAYRRPVTEQDLAAPMAFYARGREGADFEAGIREALPTILASPKFLYRAERTPAGVAPGTVHRITALDLASRLSFFLTGRGPDEELLRLAERGTLAEPAVLDAQVKRLLAAPTSHSLVNTFAFQWLKMRSLDEIEPDGVIFPNFDESLRDAFKSELALFIGSIIQEDRSVLDFMTANHTFVNERLALHYGIPYVRGERMRRVTLTDPNRFGLLGKGGVLMATSYANRTAPVIRGAWILENLLGTPPAAPPPDVEAFKENKDGEKALSIRQIMEEHRAKPSCNSCHGVMDPLGFALENFDAVGEWRSKDRYAGDVIDASGTLIDGTPVRGAADLRAALIKKPQQFVQTITEKLMTYALGRAVEAHDMPAVRKIVRDTAKDNYRFSSIVKGIVASTPFQMRKAAAADNSTAE